MSIPQDPMILLSYINTQLRDNYASLQALEEGLNIDIEALKEKLDAIDYQYDEKLNKFV